MPARQPSLPLLWLLSDARNDAELEDSLAALPTNSGFVFRHYHLQEDERRARFDALAGTARQHSHRVFLSGTAHRAAEWGADGTYGSQGKGELPYLAAAHDAPELQTAASDGATGVFLSPVFASRSHPGAKTLGAMGFHALAQQSPVPVIALGGMTCIRARELDWPRWGAIDGLVSTKDA